MCVYTTVYIYYIYIYIYRSICFFLSIYPSIYDLYLVGFAKLEERGDGIVVDIEPGKWLRALQVKVSLGLPLSLFLSLSIHTYIYLYLYIIYLSIYMCVCVFIYIHIYIYYTYIYIHISTYVSRLSIYLSIYLYKGYTLLAWQNSKSEETGLLLTSSQDSARVNPICGPLRSTCPADPAIRSISAFRSRLRLLFS